MEFDSLQPILTWIAGNPATANLIVFITAMAESMLIVGVLVPGAAMMIGFGALIGTGVLDFETTVISATLGAIVGDAISFYIGYYFRDHIANWSFFRKRPELLKKGEVFFHRHGGKSVVFGRFVGPVRAVIPTIAGMMGMGRTHFLLVNIISAILWAPVYLLPGIIVGTSLTIASQVTTRLAILVVGLFGAVWLLIWSTKRILDLFEKYGDDTLNRVLRWCWRHPLIGRPTAALIDPSLSPVKGIAYLALIGFSAILGVAIALSNFLGSNEFYWNATTFNVIQSFRTAWLDDVMIKTYQLTRTTSLIFYATLFSIWLLITRQTKTFLYWISTFSFVSVLLLALQKILVGYGGSSTTSLPAADFAYWRTGVIVLLLGFVAMLFSTSKNVHFRWINYSASLILGSVILYSIVYLGHAEPLGVLGAACIGLGWLVVISIAFRKHRPIIQRTSVWIGLSAMVTLFGFLIFKFGETPDTGIGMNQSKTQIVKFSKNEWLTFGWKQLPDSRIDLGGAKEHWFTIQWADSKQNIENELRKMGWFPAVSWTIASSLSWLDPNVTIDRAPLLPKLHAGMKPAISLVMVDPTNKHRQFVARFWESNFLESTRKESIYVGNIAIHNLQEKFRTLRLRQSEITNGDPSQFLNTEKFKNDQQVVIQSDGDRRVFLVTSKSAQQ